MDFTAGHFGVAHATARRELVALGVDVGGAAGGLKVDLQLFKGPRVYDNGPPVHLCQGPIALSAKPVEIVQARGPPEGAPP